MTSEVHQFLRLAKILMITTGQWEFKSQNGVLKKLYKKFRYALLIYWTLLSQVFFVTIIMQWECKVVLIENIFNYLHSVVNIFCTILLRSESTKKVLSSIYHYENFALRKESEEINKMYSGSVRENDRIATCFYSMMVIAIAFWSIACLITEFTPTERCQLTNGLMFQIWYPFDINEHKWIGTLVDVSLLTGGPVIFLYAKIVPTVMMLYVVAKLKIVQSYVETLDRREERIRDVLIKHQEAIRIMENVQKANRVVVMILFYGNILDLPSYIIQMMFGEKYLLPKNCGIFTFSLISVYIFCRVANSLITESTKISEVIYEKTDWTSYDKRHRSSLALMMLRSQKPLTLRAATIGVVSLSTFLQILKLCYTTTTYFTTVYN